MPHKETQYSYLGKPMGFSQFSKLAKSLPENQTIEPLYKPQKIRKNMISTNSPNVKAAFERLSKAALIPQDGPNNEKCEVSRNDLATLLMAYQLEKGNTEKALNQPSNSVLS